jgi:putative hydrolase of HD superfamily
MDTLALKQFMDFASELEKLKKLERFKGQPFWRDYPEIPRYESVADHTWRLGMLVLMFSEQLSQKIDLEKALKMVLVHDLPEIITGDWSPIGEDGTGQSTYALNPKKAHEKHAGEEVAARQLFSMLPEDLAKEFYNIWLDYDLQTSFEAKVVKSLDKIEALLQVSQYRHGHLFEKHLAFNISYALKWSDIDPAISKFGNMIVDDMKKNYREFKKNPI